MFLYQSYLKRKIFKVYMGLLRRFALRNDIQPFIYNGFSNIYINKIDPLR